MVGRVTSSASLYEYIHYYARENLAYALLPRCLNLAVHEVRVYHEILKPLPRFDLDLRSTCTLYGS